MTLRLFNTAAQSLEEFHSDSDIAGIYVCGITPYDGGHLGHAFTYHTFDVLARRLKALGKEVRVVRNVTDVDDDLLRVARERNRDWRELGNTVTAQFNEDMAAINILALYAEPRATQYVEAIAKRVGELIRDGFAYVVDGWVYYEVAKDPEYGEVSHFDRDTMIALSRERGANPEDPRKRDALDFVLWQPSGEGEPSWPAPFGDGRPGWHIECSVMSTSTLSTPIAVHGGGDDLIFPHHECEAAQCYGFGVKSFVRSWVHVAAVGYEGEKMSKSLGNLVFVRDLLQQGSANAIRLMLAAHQHRDPWEYHDNDYVLAREREQSYLQAINSGAAVSQADAGQLKTDFWSHVDNDLDTPMALQLLDDAAANATTTAGDASVPLSQILPELLEVTGCKFA